MKVEQLVKGGILVFALLITISSAMAAYYDFDHDFLFEREIGTANYGDRLYPLVDSYVKVNLENENHFPLDDVTVSIWIPDLMIYTRTSSFTVYPDDTYGKVLFMEVPVDVIPGTYLTRVLLSNEYDYSVKWQYLDIY